MPKQEVQGSFDLTREEQLEWENIQLKIQMLNQQMQVLIKIGTDWNKGVSERVGEDISSHIVDLANGRITAPPAPPVPVQRPEQQAS